MTDYDDVQIIQEGFLFKLAIHNQRNWRERYFTVDLSSKKLACYRNKGDGKPKRTFRITRDSTVSRSRKDGRDHCFKIATPNDGGMFLQAPSTAEVERWMRAIRAVISSCVDKDIVYATGGPTETGAARPRVDTTHDTILSIVIPSVSLDESSAPAVIVFLLEVKMKDLRTWVIEKRYADFHTLHRKLRKKYSSSQHSTAFSWPRLPPPLSTMAMELISEEDEAELIGKQQCDLEDYLNEVTAIHIAGTHVVEVTQFLEVEDRVDAVPRGSIHVPAATAMTGAVSAIEACFPTDEAHAHIGVAGPGGIGQRKACLLQIHLEQIRKASAFETVQQILIDMLQGAMSPLAQEIRSFVRGFQDAAEAASMRSASKKVRAFIQSLITSLLQQDGARLYSLLAPDLAKGEEAEEEVWQMLVSFFYIKCEEMVVVPLRKFLLDEVVDGHLIPDEKDDFGNPADARDMDNRVRRNAAQLHRTIRDQYQLQLHVGMHPDVTCKDPAVYAPAIAHLHSFDTLPLPSAMIQRLLELIDDIYEGASKALAKNGKGIKSLAMDHFLPLLIFVFVSARPQRPQASVEFVRAFGCLRDTRGEAGYFLTVLSSAISYVANMDDVPPADSPAASSPAAATFAVKTLTPAHPPVASKHDPGVPKAAKKVRSSAAAAAAVASPVAQPAAASTSPATEGPGELFIFVTGANLVSVGGRTVPFFELSAKHASASDSAFTQRRFSNFKELRTQLAKVSKSQKIPKLPMRSTFMGRHKTEAAMKETADKLQEFMQALADVPALAQHPALLAFVGMMD